MLLSKNWTSGGIWYTRTLQERITLTVVGVQLPPRPLNYHLLAVEKLALVGLGVVVFLTRKRCLTIF